MLTVTPVGKDITSDALEIQCEGKIRDDLQPILASVVDQYIKATIGDSKESSSDSVALIKELQTKLQNDRETTRNEYFERVKNLGVASENERGRFENPYLAEIEKLNVQRDKLLDEYREADQLLQEVQNALSPDRPSDDSLKLAVIESNKYFNLVGRDDGYSLLAIEDQQRVLRYEQRIETANAEVLALEAEREETAKRYGEKHPRVEFIDSKFQAALAAKNRLSEELDALRSISNGDLPRTKKNEAAIQDARARDEELVRMYMAALQNQRERAKYNLEKITEDIAIKEEKSREILKDIVEVNMLREKLNDSDASVSQVLEKLAALEVMSGQKDYSNMKVKVIDTASTPEQVFPILWKFLAVGILIGAFVGAGLAVLIDHSDLAYRTPIDIQESMNVPVLCKVPKIKKGKMDKDFAGSPMLVAAINPSSSAAETFRAARTSLLFAAGQSGHKVFMFTSPSPGDGKSTTVANLALSLAQTNKTVCLVDADYRRPRVQQNFGVQFEPGGVQYLLGEVPLDQALRPCAFQNNLTLLTTGGRPKNPGELVASREYAEMVAELRKRFDLVLIDSPPVIPVADATSLSSVVDGIIMVLRIRRGVILSAHKAKERLDLVQGNLMGVIVNGMDENLYYNEYGTYYRGAYYYGYQYARSYDREYSDYSDKVRDRGAKKKKVGNA
jgi:capsular exopolysaccharide synthesis family protein